MKAVEELTPSVGTVIRRLKPASDRRVNSGHRVGGTSWKNPLIETCWQGVEIRS